MATREQCVLAKFKLKQLYSYQLDVLQALSNGKSVFVSQGTGGGKSLCYQAFTTFQRDTDCIVLVVSPLLSIMEEQVEYMRALNISCVQLGKDIDNDLLAKDGKMQYIYGSPESFPGNDSWRKTLQSAGLRGKIKLIAVDEAHLVVHW